MFPEKCCRSGKPLFVSVRFHGDHKADEKMTYIWPPSVLGILLYLKQLSALVCVFVLIFIISVYFYVFICPGLSISSFAMSQDVMEGEEDADIAVEMEDGMSMDEDLSIQEGHRSEESETSITDQVSLF